MKKHLLLTVLAGLLAVSGHAQSLLSARFGQSGKDQSTLTPNLKRTTGMEPEQLLIQDYQGGTWQDNERTVYSRYTANSLPGRLHTDTWRNAWVPKAENRRRYTAAGDVLSDTLVSFQPAPLVYAAITYKYANAQLQQQVLDFLNPLTQAWEPTSRDTHSYNAASQRTEVLEEYYAFNAYDTLARSLFGYTAQGQVAEIEKQSRSGSNWDPSQKVVYTYDGQNRLVTVTSQTAFTGPYTNSQRVTYQYGGSGLITDAFTEEWDNGAWNKYAHSLLTYTAQGYPLMEVIELWNGTSYQSVKRGVFTYRTVTGTAAAATLAAQLTVAPNPLVGAATIRYTLPAAAAVTVEVRDMLGRLVRRVLHPQNQVAGPHTVPFAAEGLPAGLYIVRLTAGSRNQQVKVVVE